GVGLGCIGQEALVDGAPSQRCTKVGCEAASIEQAPTPKRQVKKLLHTIVGQKQLTVLATADGAGIQYAVGAAPWQRLLDDRLSGGTVVNDSTVTDLRLFGLGKSALLLLGTRRGVYAL